MNKKHKTIMWWVIILGAIAGLIAYAVYEESKPGEHDAFATCIKDSGAQFYGAFWCPHCQSQKKMFGKSAEKLPYIECSTANGQGQLPVCTDAGIKGYPTWRCPDGTEKSGTLSFAELADKTKCTQ